MNTGGHGGGDPVGLSGWLEIAGLACLQSSVGLVSMTEWSGMTVVRLRVHAVF